MLIRYEDLVADTTGHHRRLADFLDVPFEPRELTARQLRRHPLFPERESWKGNATGDVTKDRIETWRDSLTDEDVAAVQATCAVEMGGFGYEMLDAGPAPTPSAGSRELVLAFRHWYESVAALDALPIN